MAPTLQDGDIILTKKPRSLRPGLIYVIDHPDLGRIVKRLSKIDTRGLVRLSGDNPQSTPDKLLGAIQTHYITQRAWLVVGKNGIKRL